MPPLRKVQGILKSSCVSDDRAAYRLNGSEIEAQHDPKRS